MKRILLFLVCAVCLMGAVAQARIITWSTNQNLDLPVYVAAGDTLQILAGVQVTFLNTGAFIEVQPRGCLLAQGTDANAVVFQGNSVTHRGYIQVDSNATAKCYYTETDYMSYAFRLIGGTTLTDSARWARLTLDSLYTSWQCDSTIVAVRCGWADFPRRDEYPDQYTHNLGRCRFSNYSMFTIGDNLQIYMQQDVELRLNTYSRLVIGKYGTISQYQAFQPWYGITADHCTYYIGPYQIWGFNVCGLHSNDPISIPGIISGLEGTTFYGDMLQTYCPCLRLWGSSGVPQYANNILITSVAEGASGLYTLGSTVKISNSVIEACPTVNSYINSTTGTFSHCTFRDRTSYYGVLFNDVPCTPDFKCCLFENLAPYDGDFISTIFCGSGTGPTFGGEGFGPTVGVANSFVDSSYYLMIMQESGTLPIIDTYPDPINPTNGGHNNWYQYNESASGRYFWWQDCAGTYRAQQQYWNLNPTDARFTTACTIDRTNRRLFAWEGCNLTSSIEMPGGDQFEKTSEVIGMADSPEVYRAFNQAMAYEGDEDYSAAQDMFTRVALRTVDTNLMWSAASHAVADDRFLNANSNSLPRFLSDVAARDADAYHARVAGKELLAGYYAQHGERALAMNVYADLLEDQLTRSDYVPVASAVIGLQMLTLSSEMDTRPMVSRIPSELVIQSVQQGLRLEQELLRTMNAQADVPTAPHVAAREFALHQNYPNPFNPTTEIRFDLPQATHVELKVYNSLGQMVSTLVDEARPAGSYTVTWDGHDVASGLYLCRMKAGNFTATTKMLLMK